MDDNQFQKVIVGSPSKGDTQRTYTCMGCRVKFDSGELQRNHFKTDWHLYNLKRRVCKLDPVDLNDYDAIVAAAPKKTTEEEDRETRRRKHKKSTSSTNQQDVIESDEDEELAAGEEDDDDDLDEDWEDIEEDNEDFLDEEYDEEEAAEMLARVVKSDTCLFCDKKSSNIAGNLHHMSLTHGFFIPEDQYLIDLEGIMEYLGFKVGAGATCLWCNKQFTTVHGVRLHMIYKNHCKILYDQEKAVEEFKEFYDYSKQEQIQMKPLNQLAIPKRRTEKREEYDRSLAKFKRAILLPGASNQLVAKKPYQILPGSYQAKNIKKFNAYRAKIVLRTGMANNQTMRGRLRQQNPI